MGIADEQDACCLPVTEADGRAMAGLAESGTAVQ